MSKKFIFIIIIIVVILALGIYQFFIKKEETVFTLEKVTKATVLEEVSETGTVKKREELSLGFKNSGRIEKIYVKVGQDLKTGDILAQLDANQLAIQLKEAKANFDLSQAKLDKLLAGASPEEIQIAKTATDNANTNLSAAKQSLEDIKSQASDDLESAYEDALNALDDAYLKIYNAYNNIDLIQRAYFVANDEACLKVKENKEKANKAVSDAKFYLDAAKASSKNGDIDIALSKMKTDLKDVFDALKVIRENCETADYRSKVSSTDKTSLDTHRGYINTALTNIANSQQTISSAKLTNEYDINTAQAKVFSAEGSLKTAQDELAKITAPPRKEDVDLYQAQTRQAEAQVSLLENQIEDTILRSPTSGQIVKIEKREGETVLQEAAMTLLPASPFEIKADIYEEDVVKMKVGNPVEISLVAFPEQIFTGKVVEIDPTGKLIEGVVYYETTIDFDADNIPEGIKPEMTADITVKTAAKENVLLIPESALQKKNDKTVVQISENKEVKEKEIEIGLQGSNGMVEVVSGLAEGEKVIIR